MKKKKPHTYYCDTVGSFLVGIKGMHLYLYLAASLPTYLHTFDTKICCCLVEFGLWIFVFLSRGVRAVRYRNAGPIITWSIFHGTVLFIFFSFPQKQSSREMCRNPIRGNVHGEHGTCAAYCVK